MRRVPALIAALMLAACGESPTRPDLAGLAVVAGPERVDTIGAYPTQLLVVEVRDLNGRPVANTDVVFASAPAGEPAVYSVYEVRTTDNAGRATTRIRFGAMSGSADLTITAPDVGVFTSVRYEIRPGRPIQMEAADQLVMLGDTVRPDFRVLDRNANEITGLPLTLEPAGGVVAVTQDGRLYGTALGSGTVRIRVGDLVQTAGVTVMPFGGIAAYRPALGAAPGRFETLSLDGRNRRVIAPGLAGAPAGLDFAPASMTLVYGDAGTSRIMIVSGATAAPRVLTGDAPFIVQRSPRFSADGETVYFYGERAGESGMYRSDPGGRFTLLTAGVSESDVSSDGLRLVYARDGELFVQDTRSAAATALGVSGRLPRWSPDGSRIAWVTAAQRLAVMDLQTRTVVDFGVTGALHSLDWSPLGGWLLTAASTGVLLVDVTGGRVLTLPATYLHPAWHYLRES